MKKGIKYSIGFLVIMGILLVSAPKVMAKSYYFSRFDVDIYINSDSTFLVEERQTFVYEGDFSYAYRNIPIKRFDSISDIEVWDEDEGRQLIGGEVSVTGYQEKEIKWYYDLSDTTHTWLLKYKIHGGIGYFSDHDELWWEAIYADRDVPISAGEIKVHLPQSFSENELRERMFVGPVGSSFESQDFEIEDGQTLVYRFSNLSPNEGVSIVASWPPGVVQKPPLTFRRFVATASAWLGWIIPLLTLAFMFYLWWTRGRDKGRKLSIAPEFAPPDKLLPAEIGVLMDERADMKDITATIVDLARRGFLKISEKEEKKFLGKQKNYVFEKKKEFKDLSDYEYYIIDRLFGGKRMVNTSELKNHYYSFIPKIFKKIYEAITDNNLFLTRPDKARQKFLIPGIIITILGGLIIPMVIFLPVLLLGIGVLIAGIIIIVFSFFMPAKTKEGRETHRKWQGFRMFLKKTDRFGISDNVSQEVFEEYLPFAIVMGVEKEWANRFADLKFSEPDWYSGRYVGGFSSSSFTSSLGGSLSSISSAMAASPSSSSGFGGGGGVGGGGGGGGGGAG